MAIKLIKSSFYNEQEEKQRLCEFIKDSQQFSFWKYCKLFEKNMQNGNEENTVYFLIVEALQI